MGCILFVHGMGYDPREDYWRDWAGPLREALHREGVQVEDGIFGGIYYYDLVPGPAALGCSAEFLRAREHFLDDLREFAFQNLTARGEKFSWQPRGLVKNLINYLVDNFGDIFFYLYIDFVFQAVNWRLYEKLLAAGEPVHLLGYSLGSLVGYCALQASPPLAGRVAHFVMLGSPLFWFARGVARRADLNVRPAVGRFTNAAGIVDIAWPHLVPRVVQGLDENVEFIVDRFNPIRGHHAYFRHPESLRVIAQLIAKTWGDPQKA